MLKQVSQESHIGIQPFRQEKESAIYRGKLHTAAQLQGTQWKLFTKATQLSRTSYFTKSCTRTKWYINTVCRMLFGERLNQFVQLNHLVRRLLMHLSNLQPKSEEAIYNLSRPLKKNPAGFQL